MTEVLHDLRYAFRGLRKNRAFALVAVLSVALGIGANTTIFTLVRALFLRPFPVRDPGSIASVFTYAADSPTLLLNSYLNFRDYRGQNTVFSGLLLYFPSLVTLAGHGDPQLLTAHLVTANYFEVLGVQLRLGRSFRDDEDAAPPGAAVAVLSYALWQRLYGGDGNVTSRTIELNGRPYAIIGVAPPGFKGLNHLNGADVFVPVSTYPTTFPSPAQVVQRGSLMFSVAGRLKPGLTLAQAEAGMQTVAAELERIYPRENRGRRIKLTSLSEASMTARTRPVVERVGTLLMIISSLVLLIGCGNVANLLLARAAGRSREIAVRLALGASRGRLLRQLITESLVLSLTGGAAGLLVARWARDVLWSIRGPVFNHAGFDLAFDMPVLLFNVGVSIATGLLFGVAPALRATQPDLVSDLKDRAGDASSGSHGVGATRSVLVITQVTLAMVTLTGAVLFLRSLHDANHIDPGYDMAHLAIVAYNVNSQGYNEARGREYHQHALDRAAAVPGVLSAGLARDLPFRVATQRGVLLEGRDAGPGAQPRPTLTSVVWPGYFHGIGIPLLRGRDFSQAETKTSPRVAIVNETAAAAWWPGEDPIGKRISFNTEGLPVEVIGVARTVNYQNLGEHPQPFVYLSLAQYYFPTGVLYVRTAGDPVRVVAAVRRELQSLDSNLVLQAEPFEVSVRDLLWTHRLSAMLLSAFGGLALMLAVIGIYGVIAYSVRQRRREVGVRLALGATPRDVQYLVLGEGVRLIAIGVIAGSIVSLAVAGSIESMLFLKSPRDMFTFTMVPATLTFIGVLACWAPAVRSSRTDPGIALRDE